MKELFYGTTFRMFMVDKSELPDGLHMKNGCYWMVFPDRVNVVEGEIQRFLVQEGWGVKEALCFNNINFGRAKSCVLINK